VTPDRKRRKPLLNFDMKYGREDGRGKAMTTRRALLITQQKGRFEVSWQWRNDALRKALVRLTRQGWLRKDRRAPAGSDLFLPSRFLQTMTPVEVQAYDPIPFLGWPPHHPELEAIRRERIATPKAQEAISA